MASDPIEAAAEKVGQFAPPGSGAWYCKRRHLFRELPPRARRRLEEAATRRSFQTRDVLFGHRATEGRVHLLLSGRVRLSRFDADGGETQLAILEPGEAYRESRHAEVEPRRLYAEALAPGELLSLDLEALGELVRRDPEAFGLLGGALD